jgi:hypothetical protein
MGAELAKGQVRFGGPAPSLSAPIGPDGRSHQLVDSAGPGERVGYRR